jgi:hypothetical protein
MTSKVIKNIRDKKLARYICRLFLNSHLFWLNSHPFFHPKRGRTQVWGLWSIRTQLENLPAEVIELIKEHTLKV